MEIQSTDQLFGVTQIADALNIRRKSVLSAIDAGSLQAERVGTSYVVRSGDLVEYLLPRIEKAEARLVCLKFALGLTET